MVSAVGKPLVPLGTCVSTTKISETHNFLTKPAPYEGITQNLSPFGSVVISVLSIYSFVLPSFRN